MADRSIAGFPPASKLVYVILDHEGPLTQEDIADRSMPSPRKVRDAIGRLRSIDVVAEGVYIPDARKRLYRLTGERRPFVGAGSVRRR